MSILYYLSTKEETMFFINLPAKLLKYYYSLGLNCIYYIKKPKSTIWYKVEGLMDELVILEATKFPVKKISALIVAYSSGELLDESGKADYLPKGVSEVRDSGIKDDNELALEQVDLTGTILEIGHLSNKKHPRKGHYITEITNRTGSPMQIIKFGGYDSENGKLLLSTVTDSFYTQEQFNEWFNVQNDGWIEPGETVRDPNNYGSGDAYWVYFCQNREGKSFIIGSRMPS